MKKITGIILLFIICLSQTYAEVIDKPVARVKLIETDVIYQSEFKVIVKGMETKMKRPITAEEKKAILDKLVEEKLIVQAAKKDKISTTQSEVDGKIKQLKQMLELQEGKKYTDEEFRDRVVKQTEGTTWEEFIEQIRNSVIQEKYLMEKKGDKIKNVKKPTETEIEDYYKKNRRIFVSPEMMKFKHIVIFTKDVPKELRAKYRQQAEEIYKSILKGGAFDDYTEIYEKNSKTKIGTIYIDTWQIEEDSYKKIYGENFFDKMFSLSEGALSEVMESNLGYHIVNVIKKYPFKTLELNDKIPPQFVMTVREKIEAAYKQKYEMDAYQAAYAELIEELRKKADIKIYEENLSW